jgi:GDPmannose 4,6-dehydratase
MRVLIIGCRGQDGKWLSEILSTRGYKVFGIHKPFPNSVQNSKISQREKNSHITMEYCVDFSIQQTAVEFLDKIQPNFIFHLAAVHESSVSLENLSRSIIENMRNCHVKITDNLLQWISDKKMSTKLAVSLTSQMYSGTNNRTKISEDSKVLPQNVYGQTKLESFNLIQKYRDQKGVFASGLILFNHTSIYAKPDFLFRVLAKQINEYKKNIRQNISIMNADYEIDICDAREVCDAMRLSLESNFARDYVISSNNLVPIRLVIKEAAKLLNININDEEIISTNNDPQKNILFGDSKRIFTDLGWQPQISPAQLLASMVEYQGSSLVTNL